MAWDTPTRWVDRFADAVARLCGGRRPPPDSMIEKWFTEGDEKLQHLTAEFGPEWAQGIVIIDAARLLADTPTEILCLGGPQQDHEPFPF